MRTPSGMRPHPTYNRNHGLSAQPRPSLRIAPWLWLTGVCLVASSFDLILNTLLGPYIGGPVLVFLWFLGLPILLGCVGGYYQRWWVTIAGVPALALGAHVGELAWDLCWKVTPPTSLLPDAESVAMMVIAAAVGLPVASAAHVVARAMVRKERPLTLGYSLAVSALVFVFLFAILFGLFASIVRWTMTGRQLSFELLMSTCVGAAAVLAYIPARLLFGHLRSATISDETWRCRRCGYNLTGNVSGVCPECGTRIDGDGVST